jgi:hypothetical chaperone protein
VIGVGVDFGTSNSTVAWFDGRQLRFVGIETNSPILPTAIHLSKEFEGTTGTAAIERYVQENAARLVHLVPEILGQAAGSIEDSSPEHEMAELTMSRNVVLGPLTDHGLPGRLFLGLKRLLGNPAIDRIFVFNRPYRLVALLPPVLLRLHEAVAKELRAPVSQAYVGRPVNFEGGDVSRNSLAVSRLREACAHAGFRTVEFYPEPIAATLSFLWQRQVTGRGTVLTVDFGGGTLDLSVIRYSGAKFDVLSTAGADLGGDRIDQLIFRRLLFPLLGDGEVWSRQIDGNTVVTPFPFSEYEEGILNWGITHTLNQNRYKTRLTELVGAGNAASAKFQRLKDLINYNYSYSVFSAIKKAKAELSTRETSSIDIPELNLTVSFTRAQLNEILAPMMDRLAELVHQAVGRANLPMNGIDLVVRTGGSSQIVAVRQLLESLFPDKVTEHDPFTSVASGLAIADYHGYRWK